jgi:hypothetical protein
MEFERILQAIMNSYRESLNRAYVLDHNRSSIESLMEAKEVQTATLVELRGLRQQVVIAEKEVQAQYNSDMSAEAANAHPWIKMFSGRGAAGHERANKKRDITNRKNREIAPYREVKLLIDGAVADVSADKRETALALSQARAQRRR